MSIRETVRRGTSALAVIFTSISDEMAGVALCSRCHERPRRRTHRYCAPCHAAYMREWRKSHPLNPEQRWKDNSRSYAGVYKRRGRIVQQPCVDCGSRESQMHHEDYDAPLSVTWLCRRCHLARHAEGVE